MVRDLFVAAGSLLGLLALSACAGAAAGWGDAPAQGWAEGPGLGLAFAEPAGLALGPARSDLVREPASPADLAIRPDFDPVIDAPPIRQEAIETAGSADKGREVATGVFDDPLMTDHGVLPPAGDEGPRADGEASAEP